MGNLIPQTPPTTPPTVENLKYYCVTTQYWQSIPPLFGCTGESQGMCQYCYQGYQLASLFFYNCTEDVVLCCFTCPPGVGAEEIIAIIGPFDTAEDCVNSCQPECIGP